MGNIVLAGVAVIIGIAVYMAEGPTIVGLAAPLAAGIWLLYAVIKAATRRPAP